MVSLSAEEYKKLLEENKIDEFVLKAEQDALSLDEEIVRIQKELVGEQRKLMKLILKSLVC